jgi:hypothetical protein
MMEPFRHKAPNERGQYRYNVGDMTDDSSFESVAKLMADNIKIGLKIGWGLKKIVPG